MIFAVLALIATSLTFPWAASAQETSATPTTSATTQTTSAAPSARSDGPTGATSSGTATTSAQPRTSTSARTTPSSVPSAEALRQAPRVGTRNVEPFALNPGIVVTIEELERYPDAVPPGETLLIGDTVGVQGTWTAPDDAVGGDQFTIAFPDALEVETEGFPLNGDGGTVWGNCAIANNTVTCTLTDTVNDLSDVGGTFYLYSTATERVTSETVEFRLSGEVTVVDLPGDGGIGDGVTIGDAEKSGAFTPDKQAITWTIDIPGSELAALADENGAVTLEDTLSPNMQLCVDRSAPSLRAGRGDDMPVVPGGVSVTQGGAGSPISIVIDTGEAFDEDFLYRVQYMTCTTSGEVDPSGTQYTNSVDIGGTVVGEGIGQTWTPTTSPSKSGSWAGGSRYSRLNWDVFVPGTVFTADGSVTIDESLSTNHGVCADGLGLTVTMRDHLPLPGENSSASTRVTDRFTITGQPADGATSFTLGLTWNDGEFDPEKYYIIEFPTCVTGDEVPDSTVEFTNTATINGAVVSNSVKGHTFPGNKGGTYNQEPRVVNGEEQPAGTTIDWRIDVPGHDFEELSEAVIEDTFSESQAVCEVGDDLKENLNLTVTARDFQNNADENATRDLTEGTSVTLEGRTLTFTLPREEGDYNREITYDIDYTLCTSSGGVDARGTVYSNDVAGGGFEEGASQSRSSGAGGTGRGVARGSFSLDKVIAPFSEEFARDTPFTVQVEEFAPGTDPATATPDEKYTVEVTADGPAVSGHFTRGAGWQIRLTEINLPHGNGVYFEPGVFLPADGVQLSEDRTQALVTIQPRVNVEVQLENNAQYGSARVTKNVVDNTAGGLTGDERFVVRASIDTGVEGSGTELREFTLGDGQFYDLGDLPVGTEVTFTEVEPVDTDRVTWSEPVIEPQRLVIGQDAAANVVVVTNEASITQGTFEISKALTGPEAFSDAVPETFQVIAAWTDGSGAQRRTLTLPADGTPVPFGEDLPGGTEVTLTEVPQPDGNGLAWGVPSFSGDVSGATAGSAVVTIGREPAEVTVTNHVDRNDGTLRLTKQVSGEAAEAVGDETGFTVEARWRDGTTYRTEELTVTQGESTPLGVDLPVGTEVTFTEVARPEIAGVEWGDVSWGTDPSGESWLVTNPGGTATGIVSDDPTDGRLITLTNEAKWLNGSVGFQKFVFDGEDPVPATDAGLPAGAEFEVRIDGIDPALPADVDFPAVGDRITLDAANDWSWESGDVLPRNTVITFSEVDPAPLAGMDWARPFYYVAADAGEPGDRDTVQIVPGDHAEVEIRNRPIPTTEVKIDKIVTGPKGDQVAGDESTTFQVTATWTDPDDEERSCIVDVTPTGGMTPTSECEAAVVDGSVQFPLDTEITFIETGAHTDVSNVNWGAVSWSVADGDADIEQIEGEPTGVVVTLTGDAGDPVSLELENETSSRGLIFLPIPIPLPPFDGGSSTPPGPGSSTPPGPERPGGPHGPQTGDQAGSDDPSTPGDPARPDRPSVAGTAGHAGAPGKPAPATAASGKNSGASTLAVTGTNVAWLGGAALALIAGGAWLVLRNRRNLADTE
ncbi:peptidase [Dietzia lutea]|uniref:Peptidase n=1 Tax=Dietzia lutea TaxID=546160 RepID=A0A2S1RBN3_9ACTN|nr:peptidase [Dietzia lutea]